MSEYKGSFIGLGFVFSRTNTELIKKTIIQLIKEYSSIKYYITTYIEETDESDEIQLENITGNFIDKLNVFDYFTLKFETVLHENITQILISNSILNDYYSLQIDFHEETIMKIFDNNHSKFMKYVDNLVINLYELVKFDYAFCDNNASFEYTPLQIIDEEYKKYSLIYYPNNIKKALVVYRQDWELDGYSKRNQDRVGEFILI